MFKAYTLNSLNIKNDFQPLHGLEILMMSIATMDLPACKS